jgi:hypothetical protein
VASAGTTILKRGGGQWSGSLKPFDHGCSVMLCACSVKAAVTLVSSAQHKQQRSSKATPCLTDCC